MNERLPQLTRETPVIRQTLAREAKGPNIGLIIDDEVKGFASVRCGNLAPSVENAQVSRMFDETGQLARSFKAQGCPSGSRHPEFAPFLNYRNSYIRKRNRQQQRRTPKLRRSWR